MRGRGAGSLEAVTETRSLSVSWHWARAGGATTPARRGAGFTFGRRVVERFCEVNNVTHILRAHQLCQEGYQVRRARGVGRTLPRWTERRGTASAAFAAPRRWPATGHL